MLDKLYQYEPADFNRPIWARLVGSAAAAGVSVGVSVQNTQQLPFLAISIATAMTPGAAQFAAKWQFWISDTANITYAYLRGGEFVSTVAAQLAVAGYEPRYLVIPPLWRLGCTGFFNAGAASNTTNIYVMGWYIPRGTLALP